MCYRYIDDKTWALNEKGSWHVIVIRETLESNLQKLESELDPLPTSQIVCTIFL